MMLWSADEFAEHANKLTVAVDSIASGFMIMDIGPNTGRRYSEALRNCKTVMWNGPMGVFEWEAYSQGTRTIAETLASLDDATTVLGRRFDCRGGCCAGDYRTG